tara:strand:- start:2560 stop:3114 length:555 start_codon:yes stop_codon:yes gene_type:complete
MITFQEAISETKALYEEAKKLHGDDLIVAFNKNKNEFWADVHKWDLETLIASAATKPRVFDILVLAISKKIEEEKPLCNASREWLVKYLRGEVERPTETAGRKDTFGRDSFIVYAIQRLNNQGMPVNPRTPAASTSACEVLGKVIKPVISDKTITNIWNNRPKDYVFGEINWEQELNLFSKVLI